MADNLPDYDIMDMTEEEHQRLIQPDITTPFFQVDETTLEVNRENTPNVLLEIGDFAKSLAHLPFGRTAYDTNGGLQTTNPFDGEEPYRMNGASFVYWTYCKYGIELKGSPKQHSPMTIRKSPELRTIGDVGSFIPPEELRYGDIVYFGLSDWTMGIYIGDGEFVSFIGKGANDLTGGAKRLSLLQGFWSTQFKGHAQRLSTESINDIKPLH